MSLDSDEIGGWSNDSERFVNVPCPDCDGEGYWVVGEPVRRMGVDGQVIETRRQDCPYCGGSGVRLKK